MKIWPVGPHVGAIVRDIDGQVAHNSDAALACIFAQLAPLLEEHELEEFLRGNRAGELLAVFIQRLRIAIPGGA